MGWIVLAQERDQWRALVNRASPRRAQLRGFRGLIRILRK
jgi:hypothetical protein